MKALQHDDPLLRLVSQQTPFGFYDGACDAPIPEYPQSIRIASSWHLVIDARGADHLIRVHQRRRANGACTYTCWAHRTACRAIEAVKWLLDGGADD